MRVFWRSTVQVPRVWVSFSCVLIVTTDQRVYEWSRLLALPVDMICAYLHPRMLALHTLPAPGEGTAVLDGNEEVVLPRQLRLTSEEMTQDGAYVVENGEEMLLWIGRCCSFSYVRGPRALVYRV